MIFALIARENVFLCRTTFLFFSPQPRPTINTILIIVLPLSSLYISEYVFQNNVIKEIYAEDYLPFINLIFLFIVPLVILIYSKKKNKTTQ